MTKQYAEPATYEAKLEKVMTRLGIDTYDYDWSRHECWVEFNYKGQSYRFAHSVDNANAHGVNIRYGSDVFAQVVLSLEDLARMVERGIYDLSTWVAGMKCLPAAASIPDYFKVLQFDRIPSSIADIEKQFKRLAAIAHPDKGGTSEQFRVIQQAREQARKYFEEAQP